MKVLESQKQKSRFKTGFFVRERPERLGPFSEGVD